MKRCVLMGEDKVDRENMIIDLDYRMRLSLHCNDLNQLGALLPPDLAEEISVKGEVRVGEKYHGNHLQLNYTRDDFMQSHVRLYKYNDNKNQFHHFHLDRPQNLRITIPRDLLFTQNVDKVQQFLCMTYYALSAYQPSTHVTLGYNRCQAFSSIGPRVQQVFIQHLFQYPHFFFPLLRMMLSKGKGVPIGYLYCFLIGNYKVLRQFDLGYYTKEEYGELYEQCNISILTLLSHHRFKGFRNLHYYITHYHRIGKRRILILLQYLYYSLLFPKNMILTHRALNRILIPAFFL